MTTVLCYIAQRYSPIKIPFASGGGGGGLGNSRMFAHDSAAAFYRFIKNNNKKKRGYDSSPLLLFARGVTVQSNLADNYRRLKIHFALVVAALSNQILMLNKKHGAYNRHKTKMAILCFLLSGI